MVVDSNSIVKIKLTNRVNEELIDYYFGMLKYSMTSPEDALKFKIKLDEDGFYNFTMEEFMKIFGGKNFISFNDMFGTIEITNIGKKLVLKQ